LEFAKVATSLDHAQQYEQALPNYIQAIELLVSEMNGTSSGRKMMLMSFRQILNSVSHIFSHQRCLNQRTTDTTNPQVYGENGASENAHPEQ
jgi:hypothetical protein